MAIVGTLARRMIDDNVRPALQIAPKLYGQSNGEKRWKMAIIGDAARVITPMTGREGDWNGGRVNRGATLGEPLIRRAIRYAACPL